MFQQEHLTKVSTDYTQLTRLLATGNWQEADRETMAIILRVCDRTEEGYPKPSHIQKLPAADLQEIDRLWQHYSGGKFGFTPQKLLWIQASQNYTDFCELIGWHHGDTWLEYSEVNFSINAVAGHLPSLMFPCPLGDTEVFSFALGSWRMALLCR